MPVRAGEEIHNSGGRYGQSRGIFGQQEVPGTWGPVTMGATMRAEMKYPDGNAIELRHW